jgi:hypothetical protein
MKFYYTIEAGSQMSSAMQRTAGNYSNRQYSKMSGNQIVGTSAAADIDPGCGSAYQIAVRIERFQKARLVEAGIRLEPPQCIFVDKK